MQRTGCSVSETAESDSVPRWLWQATIGTLVLVVLAGLLAAWRLSAQPAATGADISTELLGSWTFGPGASGEADGEQLTLTTSEADRIVYAMGEPALTDFSVEVRARQLGGPDDAGYGLVARYQDRDDFVAMLIGPDGYLAIGQMSEGTWRWRVPWQEWPHIKRGLAENLLRAQCRADRCRFYVNDEFAFEVNDVPLRGQTGLAVWNPSDKTGVSAQFRGWQAWK